MTHERHGMRRPLLFLPWDEISKNIQTLLAVTQLRVAMGNSIQRRYELPYELEPMTTMNLSMMSRTVIRGVFASGYGSFLVVETQLLECCPLEKDSCRSIR